MNRFKKFFATVAIVLVAATVFVQTTSSLTGTATTDGARPNLTVNTAWTSAAFRPFNPFTDTPVECPQGTAAAQCTAMGAHWQKGSRFGLNANNAGQGTFTAGFQQTRMYRFSAGVRF